MYKYEWKHVKWHFRQILSLANYFRFFQAYLFFLSFLAFFLMYKNNSFGRNYKNFNKNKLIIYSYIFVSRPAKHIKELQNISPAITYYTCKKVIVGSCQKTFPGIFRITKWVHYYYNILLNFRDWCCKLSSSLLGSKSVVPGYPLNSQLQSLLLYWGVQ